MDKRIERHLAAEEGNLKAEVREVKKSLKKSKDHTGVIWEIHR